MLMEAWTAAARHSVFAQSQAQVSLLLANGRNANGTKSNRIALTHLPLHPKVNWPIWTNVSVTRWLFHRCWECHLLFKSAFITALNCWTIWPIGHLNNCGVSQTAETGSCLSTRHYQWPQTSLDSQTLLENRQLFCTANGKQKGCAVWHLCWLCFYGEVAHLMAALHPKSSPIEQHCCCKENIKPKTGSPVKSLVKCADHYCTYESFKACWCFQDSNLDSRKHLMLEDETGLYFLRLRSVIQKQKEGLN